MKFSDKLRNFYLINIAKTMSGNDGIRIIIDKALKKYNIDYNYVQKHPYINDIVWCSHYTFDSEEEFKSWERFSKKIIKKVLTKKLGIFNYYKPSKEQINREFSWINLMYGLKYNYESKYQEYLE